VTVRYSPTARRDLAGVHTFVWTESKSRQVADRFISRLLDAGDKLALLPSRYPVYSHRRGTRMMPFKNYIIFYKVVGDEVHVQHVRHAARRPFRK